jgi:hypothetical protein
MSFQIELAELVVEQLQVKLLKVVKVGHAKHLRLGKIMLPAEQLQKFPVQMKLASMQLQVVALSLLAA